jgi:hypothetical protein
VHFLAIVDYGRFCDLASEMDGRTSKTKDADEAKGSSSGRRTSPNIPRGRSSPRAETYGS